MKKLICVTFFAVLTTIVFAQNRSSENVEPCGTMQHLEWQKQQDPSLAKRMIEYEQGLQKWIAENKDNSSGAIVTIPVVVHVVWNTTAQNILNSRIQEQIDVLNKDFRKLNSDANKVPSVWTNDATDCEIQFCLAKTNPNGQQTTGIENRQTSKVSFGQVKDSVKHYNLGGLDAWDINKYFNIWVCNLSGGIVGYSQFPDKFDNNYGVVIKYTRFGLTGVLPPLNLGRTTTHEVGHCFNLIHIWGDENDCIGSDYCDDTPNQASAYFGCPTFPKTDKCSPNSPGTMYTNYMGYVDDACMYMFTKNQKSRILAVLNTTLSKLKTSTVCNLSAVSDFSADDNQVSLFPNPTTNNVTLTFADKTTNKVKINIYNIVGEVISTIEKTNLTNNTLELDMSSFANGIYFVNIQTDEMSVTKKVILIR